jgi:subtilisin family serine protease
MNLDGLTGRGIRVAIIDSGVNHAHPHISGIAGGVEITAQGETPVYLDYLGHGTAVTAAIAEKVPEALLYAVKVFDRTLSTTSDRILRAIDWAIRQQTHVANLSLGTRNPAHRESFAQIIAKAAAAGLVLVAAREVSGVESLPGSLSGVIAVGLDWDCPRDTYRCAMVDSQPLFFASGYPRSIPGVPVERNLHGISFAVANMSGFVARARQAFPQGSLTELQAILTDGAASVTYKTL